MPLADARILPKELSDKNWLEPGGVGSQRSWMSNPFRYFKISPEIIRLEVMMNARFLLSLWNVEDLLH